jgi:hypothetical protein
MYNDDTLIIAICSNISQSDKLFIRQSNKLLQKYYLREK